MKIVTPADMQRVDIKQGWLLDQFAELVLGLDPDEEGTITQLWLGELNTNLAEALVKYDELVYQKNLQYNKHAIVQRWSYHCAGGPCHDKLYRLQMLSMKAVPLQVYKDIA